MIPARLMQHQVTVIYRTPGPDGRYGQGDLIEGSRATVPAWMQMLDQTEVPEGEATVVGWKLMLNPSYLVNGTPVTIVPPAAVDLVEWNGRTFRAEGGSMEYRTPRGMHHYESKLAEVVV